MKLKPALLSAVLAAAITGSLVLVNVIAQNAAPRFDVTATGEHELSPRTQGIIDRLDAPFEIVVATDRARIDPGAARQVSDVLDSFDDASPNITVTEIDTADAAGLAEFNTLADRLVERERETLDSHRRVVETAVSSAESTAAWLESTLAPALMSLRDAIPASAPASDVNRQAFEQRAGVAQRVALELRRFATDAQAQLDPSVRLARTDQVAEILLPALDAVGSQLEALTEELTRFSGADAMPGAARDAASSIVPGVRARRDDTAASADELRRLDKPDILRVADALERTDAALVVAPPGRGVTAVDLAMLYPSALELRAMGLGPGDVRGRAEQLFATAIGTVVTPNQPIVVVVHAAEPGILADPRYFGYLRQRLSVRGIDFAEWACVSEPEPPSLTELDLRAERPVVYITLAPDARAATVAGVTGPERVQRFGDALTRLAHTGADILLSINASILPGYGQPDPAVSILPEFGLSADTGRPVLFEGITPAGRVVNTDHTLAEHIAPAQDTDHPIARALRGLNTKLPWAIPISIDNADVQVIYQIDPAAGAWAEAEWLGLRRVPRDQRHLIPDPPEFNAERDDNQGPWPIVVATERATENGAQRLVVVGSNDWQVNPVTAEAVAIAGVNRPANPGNAELFDATVMWLAGQDELIAQGVEARIVPTITDIAPSRLTALRWLVIAGLPALVLIAGAAWRIARG